MDKNLPSLKDLNLLTYNNHNNNNLTRNMQYSLERKEKEQLSSSRLLNSSGTQEQFNSLESNTINTDISSNTYYKQTSFDQNFLDRYSPLFKENRPETVHNIYLESESPDFDYEHLVKITAQRLHGIWPQNIEDEENSFESFLFTFLHNSEDKMVILKGALYYLNKLLNIIELYNNTYVSSTNSMSFRLSRINHLVGHNVLLCGRRTMMCLIILSTKFVVDNKSKNIFWAKMCSLSLNELNQYEIVFLHLLDHNIFVPLKFYSH